MFSTHATLPHAIASHDMTTFVFTYDLLLVKEKKKSWTMPTVFLMSLSCMLIRELIDQLHLWYQKLVFFFLFVHNVN